MDRVATSVWRPAHVVENRQVADGSMWITLEAGDSYPAAFVPGHVLGLGLMLDNGIQRHAYTVSRGEPALRRFSHLYRVIRGGHLTPLIARLSRGDTVYFHGPFHIPIQKEIHPDAERIVLIGTGTGIGPLIGFSEKTLKEGERRPIALYAGFHEASHICLHSELTVLSQTFPNFSSAFSLTHPPSGWTGLKGRVTESVPDRLDRDKLYHYHFHLVGNGEMVQLVRKALLQAGVASGRVSIETYFNHYVEPSRSSVDELTDRLLAKPGAEKGAGPLPPCRRGL